mmetsp:Transcript_35146/g.82022  ORF Transcript_35146/g.82022 Transcript_35146/m.82022 type:complete len:128 (-) Transcript_35146:40-423(-)
MLAMACDFRVMAKTQGWLCVPAVSLGYAPLPTGMFLVLKNKLPPASWTRILVLGERIDAQAAAALGVIDVCCEPGDVQRSASAAAATLTKRNLDGDALVAMRRQIFPDVIAALTSSVGVEQSPLSRL